MAKTIADVEIVVQQEGEADRGFRASISLEAKRSYTVAILGPDAIPDVTSLDSDSQAPATALLEQKLKQLVDQFDPSIALVKITKDTLNVLPKVTYRCGNWRCQTKLFESWGFAPGIRILCKKCKTLRVPKAV